MTPTTRGALSTQERRWLRLKRELSRGFTRGTCLLLDRDWLAKNDVTLTECDRMSDWIGNCLATNIDLSRRMRGLK